MAYDSAPPPTIVVSLPKQRLTFFRHGKKPVRLNISIGRQALATPTGVFKINGKYPGQWTGRGGRKFDYGAGVMTLNVRQAKPGGLPIAIHGTNQQYSIGGRTSAGCIIVRDKPLRWLLGQVPVGTRVAIRGMKPPRRRA